MSAPLQPASPAPPAASDAQRAADVSELLGHLTGVWDDERRVLARQLHDSLGSSLTALTMHLSLLVHQLPQERGVSERAAQMKQLLMNVIETNRQMQFKLWNDKLEFLGVTVALRELATDFGEQHGIAVRCSWPEAELQCPRRQGVALLRALEEALRNIAAHAGASTVDIVLDDNDEAIMLTVKDDGVGLRGQAADEAPPRHGLRAVRERVAHLGGSLELSSEAGPGTGPGSGTTLTVILPRPAV